jgi:hypothetical protein
LASPAASVAVSLPNAASSAFGDYEDLDEIVPNVLRARIGHTFERGDEELHGWTPR